MRTRFLRTSLVGALVVGLMAGGAAPAMADPELEYDAPVIESVNLELPDGNRDWILPGETATLAVVYTDANPDLSGGIYSLPYGAPDVAMRRGYGAPLMNGVLSSNSPEVEPLADGTQRVTLRVDYTADESTIYSTYGAHPDLAHDVVVRDVFGNRGSRDAPPLRVDDPAHPLAAEASLDVSQGAPAQRFGMPTNTGRIWVGDTLHVNGGAVGTSSETVEWQQTYSDARPELISGTTVRTGNGAGELQAGQYGFRYRATWPDGVVRFRNWNMDVGTTWMQGPLGVERVYVNYGRVVLDRPAQVGGTSTARFELSRTDMPFSLGTPTFTWWVKGRKISGPSASFIPGDTNYRVDVSFTGVPPYAYAIDQNETELSHSGTVGAGSMPDTTVSLGTAKVGSPLVAAVGPSKGASSVLAWWVVDGKDVTFDEVSVAGGKISWTPEARYRGKSVQLALVRTYGLRPPTQGPRQLAPTKVTVSAGVQAALSTPVLRGSVRVGSKVTLQQSGQPVPGAKRSIVWLRNGKPIPKATGWSYTPVAADKGSKLTARITSSASGYVTHVSQAAAKTVAAGVLKRGKVSFISTHQTVGETWKADVYGWDRGVKVKYQWLRDGKVIKKATASKYKLTRADRRHKVSLRITVSKPGYTSVVKTSNWGRVY